MPLYEHRCPSCGCVTTALQKVTDPATPVRCESCGAQAPRIVSRPSVQRSAASKVERLDPRYHKMVDKAMADTRHAEPDRHLQRGKPPNRN